LLAACFAFAGSFLEWDSFVKQNLPYFTAAAGKGRFLLTNEKRLDYSQEK